MEIFLDTANLDEIRSVLPWGIISGLTTNQKILLREKGVDLRRHMEKILSLVDGPCQWGGDVVKPRGVG